MTEWFNETLHRDIGQRFAISRVIFRERTAHQDLVIFENPVLGRILALDGVVQTAENDEFIYHEMLAHVPILAHGRAKRVLIVGGGDGGMAREALKHQALERVTMVEIDRGVVDLCAAHIPSIGAAAFKNPRLDLVIADGAQYVKTCAERFDVVIIDSTDPQGPGAVLFTREFYRDCQRCLTPGGILVTQNGVPFLQPGELRGTAARLKGLFADTGFYAAAVPSYYGGFMAFGWGSDRSDARRVQPDELARRFAAAGIDTRYYTPALHAASFALPRYIERLLAA
ncbi:MAG: polyamine aminopropyltransferase [Alphaproteobacteria bacterium]|nr:polyamine aminopropyltransferase [Alphaproteobacteria bacterium]